MNKTEILDAINSISNKNDCKEIFRAVQKRLKDIKANDYTDEEFISEPNFGMLCFSRKYTSGKTGLFGSNIAHDNIITMTLKRGSERRSHFDTHYFGEDTIAEVNMSYSQFAELISSFSMGDGVPVTLSYTEVDGNISFPKVPNSTKLLGEDFKYQINTCKNIVSDAQKKAETLLNKTSVTKRDREELLHIIENLKMNIGSNTEFMIRQHQKHMEKTVTEAKGEVEAFAQNKLHSIAMEAIAKNIDSISMNNPVAIDLSDESTED